MPLEREHLLTKLSILCRAAVNTAELRQDSIGLSMRAARRVASTERSRARARTSAYALGAVLRRRSSRSSMAHDSRCASFSVCHLDLPLSIRVCRPLCKRVAALYSLLWRRPSLFPVTRTRNTHAHPTATTHPASHLRPDMHPRRPVRVPDPVLKQCSQ